MSQLNQVCYRGIEREDSYTLAAYQAIGGYSAWRKILEEKTDRNQIIEVIKASGLKGRGGAGFSTGLKWSFVDKNNPKQKFLVCNSDEGEPGTCKDTLILSKNPHQLLEGMAICAYVMGATKAYNYMRGEFFLQYQRCEQALNDAISAGLLGKNCLGTGVDVEIFNILGAGSYIVGEETAMLESLEGKRAQPRYKPPFPAVSGLYGMPTIINNTETLASVPVILEKGAEWFAQLGTKGSGGTKIFCVSGHVNQPGVFEVPMGIAFSELLEMAGGVRKGRKLKAVIPGGTSMRILSANKTLSMRMDYEDIAKMGSALGSGGVIIMDDSTCMVQALCHMMRFYEEESCGQCTPCREGSGCVYKILKDMVSCKARPDAVEQLYTVAKKIEGRTICAFGEAISWPVTSFIDTFREEFDYIVANQGKSWVESQVAGAHERAFGWHAKDNRDAS